MGHPTIEQRDKDAVSIAELNRMGLLSGGIQRIAAGLKWPKLDTMVVEPHGIHLHHRNGQEQTFRISWGRFLYGSRPWFVCHCGQRVGKLYRGWTGFACRWCHGLWYSSQACSERKRQRLRIAKECSKIDGRPYLHITDTTPPKRPKGFHRKRYHQIRGVIADLSIRYRDSASS
jgi:hypothetical protein